MFVVSSWKLSFGVLRICHPRKLPNTVTVDFMSFITPKFHSSSHAETQYWYLGPDWIDIESTVTHLTQTTSSPAVFFKKLCLMYSSFDIYVIWFSGILTQFFYTVFEHVAVNFFWKWTLLCNFPNFQWINSFPPCSHRIWIRLVFLRQEWLLSVILHSSR